MKFNNKFNLNLYYNDTMELSIFLSKSNCDI